MTKPTVSFAPEKSSGDQIELSDLRDKVIAIYCKSREENKKTRFNLRSMTHVAVLVDGAKDPLEGVLFQSYFQTLKLNQWFIGKLERQESASNGNRAWVLNANGLDKKAVAGLLKTIEAAKIDEPKEPEVLA